ncbi:protein of unknown function [Legionella micdadei]|uniref:Uncharacterized protein n=1 Tax=Legionella micdadei TaxID=451 RepID=A0A098GI43_LEGMI|nr:protein of unknown function [Legionella micdadei]
MKQIRPLRHICKPMINAFSILLVIPLRYINFFQRLGLVELRLSVELEEASFAQFQANINPRSLLEGEQEGNIFTSKCSCLLSIISSSTTAVFSC